MQHVSNVKRVCCISPSTSALSPYQIMQHGLDLSILILKCMQPFSEHNILPVHHAGMKRLLQTLLLLRSAVFEASWKAAGGAGVMHPGSCSLPLLGVTGAAIQPGPSSLPGHWDLSAGCLEIHVWINLVSHRLLL